MRVAIVHDWLNQRGGAEEVLEVLHAIFPSAPIFTSIFVPEVMPAEYRSWPVYTSFLQRLPAVDRYHRALLPLYPAAFRSFDLSGYDLVISNSSGFCHGVATTDATCHINYCLTPPRYVWGLDQYAAREQLGTMAKAVLPLVTRHLRRWDLRAAAGIDHFIAISRVVQERIGRFYGREAAIIYPPVNTSDLHTTIERGDYFLIVSRLVPYKRIDLAVAAFNEVGWPLLVVGEGRDRAALERLASPNVQFLGRRPRDEVRELMARCRAFIFPGEEDFGIAPVEAQAAGRPVIAYAGGGALETVLDGVSGLFFRETTPQSLVEALIRFSQIEQSFDARVIREHAQRFDTSVFRERITAFIADRIGAGVASRGD
ncbi:MAG: glycosyltransferase [Dehalococcoidia bacterium]|nr:glycosyltransferase [Dehalococcoidia bacterium]